MAVKIVDLPSETAVTDDDYIVVRDNATGTTRRITRANFFLNPPIPNNAIVTAMINTGAVTKAKLEANARIDPRVNSVTNSSSLTVNSATTDIQIVSALAGTMAIQTPSGTPVDGQALLYRIKDNGTGYAISWSAGFRAIGVTPPGSTTAGKWLYVSCRYNAADAKWDMLSVGREA